MKTINVNDLAQIFGGNGVPVNFPKIPTGGSTTTKDNGGVIVINDPAPTPKLPTM
ncbi:MAG: hypothetical protein JKY55_19480 [Aliivibrio sp.]|uniref:hypothetical protein n=1 Tax=Aliivibrio sp. TaxID=1872443 RepID=UPI001A37EF11|nr:hypothetical protein [Aliivibrio sp.]